MPTTEKLPSGMWRTRAFYTDANGRHQKSFTAESKKESEFLALEFLNSKQKKSKSADMTLKEAFDAYINARENVLSPSTVHYYHKMRDTYLKPLMEMKLSALTEENIQAALNAESRAHSPKTVRNINGSLSAVLRAYRPEFVYSVKLPQKKKPEIYIPTSEEIKKLLEYFKDTEMEIPFMLAVFLGLHQSEIVGLKWKNVSEDCKTVKIDSAIVKGDDNKLFEKAPKSTAGNRTVSVPDELAEKMQKAERRTEYVTQLNASMMYHRFLNAQKKLNIKHFRFHDLRHYNASVMLSLNVPNKYAQARMGHATDNMLKNVYQHLMSEKEKEVNDNVNKYFDDLFK